MQSSMLLVILELRALNEHSIVGSSLNAMLNYYNSNLYYRSSIHKIDKNISLWCSFENISWQLKLSSYNYREPTSPFPFYLLYLYMLACMRAFVEI